MNKKILIFVLIVGAIIVYLLFQFGIGEFSRRSSAPYPLAKVETVDFVIPDPAQNKTVPTTKTSIAMDFRILPPVYESLPMYEFNPNKSLTEETVNNIIKALDLNLIQTRQDPFLGKTTIASKDTKDLTAYLERGEIIYTNSTILTSNTGKFTGAVDTEMYKKRAEEFLESLDLKNTSYTFKSDFYVEAVGTHASFVEDKRSANIIELVYEARVENIPIINKSSSLTPNIITVGLDRNGDLIRFQYTSLGTVGSSFGDYSLIDINEIKKNIQEGKAKLINGTYPIGRNIESINIRTAKISYLSVENYLVPVYILTADVRTDDNRYGEGYLLLAAIKK